MTDRNKINIALTGLMGSGKSSVGRTLARLLKRQFIDIDILIEQKEGKSISEIFRRKGEDYFREIESQIIQEIFKNKDSAYIVSLGGGAIVDEENRELIKKNSKLIALIATPEELYERVKRRKHRPILNKAEDQLATLKKLWKERKEAYMDSHHQFETSGKEIDHIVETIISKLKLEKSKHYEFEVKIPQKLVKYFIRLKKLERMELEDLRIGHKILIVSQEPIAEHYLETVKERLSSNFEVHSMLIENGEGAKNFFSYQSILQKLLNLKFERKDTVLALGGGVIGDLCGFVASSYYRGINYIQVPTTLLSMIDSSVGGKTGINVPEGKNLIGAFYQPSLVYIDVANLKTLPDKEFKSGLGELVKYTLLGNRWDNLIGESFFSFISRNTDKILAKDDQILKDTIEHCLKIKSGIVAEDEKESGLRMHLNLGHTFAHAIEELTEYKRFSHGEAVAIGTVCACYLGEELDCFKDSFTERVIELMESLNLEYKIPKDINTKDILEAFQYDKKVEDAKVKFIVPYQRIGRVKVFHDINNKLVQRAIERNR